MEESMWGIIFLSAFLILMIGIGIWGMKKTSTLNDFFLGGRSIGPWVSAIAYGTTYFSAVMFIGFAGKFGWGFGLNSLWIVLGNALIGAFLAWKVLGRRTRTMTKNLDVMTMPEFFSERYESKNMKWITACIIFIFLLPYSASVFQGLGYLFEANFHIPYQVALGIMIGITGIYLVLGGYFAITLTDFIQGLIMIFGSIAMLAVLIGKAGGVSGSIHAVAANYQAHIAPAARPGLITIISIVFMTSFGTWGLPQMVQKFYAIKDETVINKAAIATAIFALIIGFAAYYSGALTHVFFTPESLPHANGKIAFDQIMPNLMTAQLPEILMALILLLVLSASMSTLSSLVLVSSSSIAIDLYKGHFNPSVSKENSLIMMRFLSVLFIIISFLIAIYKIDIIVTLMSLSWGVIAGSFMAPYLYGLYWKKTTAAGAYAGMATGGILAIALTFILGKNNSTIASCIAMIVPFIVIPVVSLLTQPPSQKTLDKAFEKI